MNLRKNLDTTQYYARFYIKKMRFIVGKLASFKVCYNFYGIKGVINKILKRV